VLSGVLGAAGSGAMVCMCNIAQLEMSTLSVLAEAMTAVRRALLSRQSTFSFNDTEVKMEILPILCATVNLPLQTNHQRISDTLRAAVRPTAVTIPDLSAFCAVLLSMHGFNGYQRLGTLLGYVLQHCCVDLSDAVNSSTLGMAQ